MRRAVPASILVGVIAVSVAACGSSSSTTGSQARAGGDSEMALIHSNALVQSGKTAKRTKSGQSTTTFVRAKAAPLAHDPVTYSHRAARARLLDKGPDDEFNSTGAKPINPCALVTRSEARAIVGQPIVRAWRAPQGPTCIYQVHGAKNFITLAVQESKLKTVRKHAHTLSHRRVRGHMSYCLKLGTTMTVVPLSGGRLLQISASCPIGSRFAAKALTRL